MPCDRCNSDGDIFESLRFVRVSRNVDSATRDAIAPYQALCIACARELQVLKGETPDGN